MKDVKKRTIYKRVHRRRPGCLAGRREMEDGKSRRKRDRAATAAEERTERCNSQ